MNQYFPSHDQMLYSFSSDSDFSDFSSLKDKMVKLTYSSDDSRENIDSFIKNIENANPYDFTIIENFVTGLSEKNTVDLSKDTLSIINEEIQNLEIDINKDEIKKITHEIYMEALDQ